MDHIGKALEKAQSSSSSSVRDWMSPTRSSDSGDVLQNKTSSPPTGDGRSVRLDPQVLADNLVIAAEGHSSAISDRYKLLRTRLLQIMRPRGWNVLGITSPTPETGKTLTTINLAVTFAQLKNQKIFVVDADLRKPSIAQRFGFEATVGLEDYLNQSCSLEDVMYTPEGMETLTIIPGVGTAASVKSGELLNSNEFARLIRHLRSGGERVTILVDTPPTQVGDDVLAAALNVDCFLMIVEEGVTQIPELEEASRLLSDHNLIGTVLNKSSEKPKKFESYYGG